LNGVPTAQGVFTFTLQATDSVGATAATQFSLTINPATLNISSSGVVNAASYLAGPVAPGEIITIFGSGLGPTGVVTFQLDSSGHFPTILAGTQVLFDGVAAPLLFVQAGQIGAIVPYEVSGEASTQIQIKTANQSSPSVVIPVVPAAPGIFAADSSGKGPGAILNQDGSLNSINNPAAVGSYVFVYATGEGQTNPPGVDGTLDGSPAPLPVLKVTATIGGIAAPVEYAGGVSSLVAGILQVNVQIPQGVTPGSPTPIIITIGGAETQPGLTAAIR